jgi:hypothetical protein
VIDADEIACGTGRIRLVIRCASGGRAVSGVLVAKRWVAIVPASAAAPTGVQAK